MMRVLRMTGLLVSLAMLPTLVMAQTQSTPARAGLLVDLSSGATLLEKNVDQPLPPASMSKLMTLFMVFEALERRELSLDDTFRTSRRASSMGGSKMFLRDRERVSIENLLRGVIVQSGNDAAVALAEALAGTEEAFAARMTERAKEIGLTDSHFVNATGWPADGHVMSARDLVRLAALIVERFPDLYTMFAEETFTWDGVTQRNRNPVLGLGVGADGLKTGHTEESGYSLVASAKRGDRRIVLMIGGLETAADRGQEAERLINWAFRAYSTHALFSAGQAIVEAPVWIGSEPTVTLVTEDDLRITAPYGRVDEVEMTVEYDSPIPAPIAKGQTVATLKVRVPDLPELAIPLVAAQEIGAGGFLTRVQSAGISLLSSILPE